MAAAPGRRKPVGLMGPARPGGGLVSIRTSGGIVKLALMGDVLSECYSESTNITSRRWIVSVGDDGFFSSATGSGS